MGKLLAGSLSIGVEIGTRRHRRAEAGAFGHLDDKIIFCPKDEIIAIFEDILMVGERAEKCGASLQCVRLS